MNAPYHIAAQAWLGASLALTGGLLIGLITALWLTAKRAAEGVDAAFGPSAADLDEQMNHCIDQLRELEEQKSRFEPDVFAQQKSEFEARAVAVMHARQTAPVKRAPKAPRPEEVSPAMRFLARRPQLRGFLWGGGLVGIVAVLYFLVNDQQPERPPAAMAGRGPMAGPAAGGAGDAEEMKTLQAALAQKPDDVPLLVKMAHLLLKNQMFNEAQTVNGLVLRHEPANIEGQVHAAVLQAAQGHGDEARADLDRLAKAHSDFAEAWFFRGMLALQHGDQEVMKESFRHFVQVATPGAQRDRIEALLRSQGG